MAGAVLGYWQLPLGAAALGMAFGVAVLVIAYIAPLARLYRVAEEGDRRRVVRQERERLRRLQDAAAVLGEHGRPGAGELRTEVELRAMVPRARPASMRRHILSRPTWRPRR